MGGCSGGGMGSVCNGEDGAVGGVLGAVCVGGVGGVGGGWWAR